MKCRPVTVFPEMFGVVGERFASVIDVESGSRESRDSRPTFNFDEAHLAAWQLGCYCHASEILDWNYF